MKLCHQVELCLLVLESHFVARQDILFLYLEKPRSGQEETERKGPLILVGTNAGSFRAGMRGFLRVLGGSGD